jgi:hypothetical protein
MPIETLPSNQPPDLGVQPLRAGRRLYRLGPAPGVEQAASMRLQLFFPLPDLGRMDAEVLGDLVRRLQAPDRRQRDLRLELAAKHFAFLLAHGVGA